MTYYEVLGVSSTASQENIKSSYRVLAKKYHPDNKATGNADKFREITEAYDILIDPIKRTRYDESLVAYKISPMVLNLGLMNHSETRRVTFTITSSHSKPIKNKFYIDWNTPGERPPDWASELEIETENESPYFCPVHVSFNVDTYKCEAQVYHAGINITIDDQIYNIPIQFEIKKFVKPQIVFYPARLDLGTLEQGDKTTCTVNVDNLGARIWNSPEIYWKDGQPGWASALNYVKRDTGMIFPQTLTFTVDTTHTTPATYQTEIIVKVDNYPFVIPVSLIVKPLRLPQLQALPNIMDLGEHEIDETALRYTLTINNLGGKVKSFWCGWKDRSVHDTSCFTNLTYTPNDSNTFPKKITFDLPGNIYMKAGDYLERLIVQADGQTIVIPVAIKLFPYRPPQLVANLNSLNVNLKRGQAEKFYVNLESKGRFLNEVNIGWDQSLYGFGKIGCYSKTTASQFPLVVEFELTSKRLQVDETYRNTLVINYDNHTLSIPVSFHITK